LNELVKTTQDKNTEKEKWAEKRTRYKPAYHVLAYQQRISTSKISGKIQWTNIGCCGWDLVMRRRRIWLDMRRRDWSDYMTDISVG
jgi:hypothetical protein